MKVPNRLNLLLSLRRSFEIDVVSSGTPEQANGSNAKPMTPTCAESSEQRGSGTRPGPGEGRGVAPDTDQESWAAAGEAGAGGGGSNDSNGSKGFDGVGTSGFPAESELPTLGGEWVSGARPVVFRMVRREADLEPEIAQYPKTT